MRTGWDQIKWLAGKKGPGGRRWVKNEYLVLVPRSNDKSVDEMEQEMVDYEIF